MGTPLTWRTEQTAVYTSDRGYQWALWTIPGQKHETWQIAPSLMPGVPPNLPKFRIVACHLCLAPGFTTHRWIPPDGPDPGKLGDQVDHVPALEDAIETVEAELVRRGYLNATPAWLEAG